MEGTLVKQLKTKNVLSAFAAGVRKLNTMVGDRGQYRLTGFIRKPQSFSARLNLFLSMRFKDLSQEGTFRI